MWKVAPLSSGFMLASILGFIISIFMIDNPTWSMTFAVFFAIMFVASVISMTYGSVDKKLNI